MEKMEYSCTPVENTNQLSACILFSGRSKKENFMEMVGHLFELGYDLALSPRSNTPESPAFEGCGLIFGK